MNNVLMKRGGHKHRDTHTQRTPWEHADRNEGETSEAKEHPKLPANYQKLGARHRTDSPLQSSAQAILSTP